MNLIFLRYFVDSFRMKSLTQAAKLNNVSVTAISKGIKSLEENLGFSLIEHQKNQLIFTKDADRIYNQSIEILDSVAKMSHSTPAGPKKIKIGLIHSLATGRLSRLIAELSQSLDLQISICNPTEMENLFGRYLIDISVSLKREQPTNSQSIVLHDGEFSLFESTEIRKKREILYVTPDWPEVESLKKSKNFIEFSQYKICVIDSWDAIYSAIKKGGGVGLLPDYFKINNKKIKKVRDFEFSYPYNVVLKYQNSFYDEQLFEKFKLRFKNVE